MDQQFSSDEFAPDVSLDQDDAWNQTDTEPFSQSSMFMEPVTLVEEIYIAKQSKMTFGLVGDYGSSSDDEEIEESRDMNKHPTREVRDNFDSVEYRLMGAEKFDDIEVDEEVPEETRYDVAKKVTEVSSSNDVPDEQLEMSEAQLEDIKCYKLPNVFKCDKCQKTFSRHSSALNHCVHKAVKVWKREECGQTVRHKNNVPRHIERCLKSKQKPNKDGTQVQVITAENKWSCQFCGREYKNWASLKTHMSMKHKDVIEGTLTCELCEFKTSNISQMKKHRTLKHEVRVEFPCDKCDYTCYSKSGINKHKLAVHYKMSKLSTAGTKISVATVSEARKVDPRVNSTTNPSNKVQAHSDAIPQTEAQFDSVEIEAPSGSVELEPQSGSVELETQSGSVELEPQSGSDQTETPPGWDEADIVVLNLETIDSPAYVKMLEFSEF